METPGSVFSGFEGEFSVTVTNNGPDVADSPGTYAPFISSANSDYIFSPDFNIVQNDCVFATFIAEPRPPVFPGGITLLIATNPIAVGDSVTCFGRYAVGFESGRRELFWETVNFGQGSLIDDPFLENNTVTVTLGIQPIPVDALGIFSMLLMMFLLVLGTSTKFMCNPPRKAVDLKVENSYN